MSFTSIRWISSLAAIAAGLLLWAQPAPAADDKVTVGGKPEAVKIEARGATVESILGALGTNFKLKYRSSAALDRQMTGTYEGPMKQVLARVLDGYNYVLKSADSGLEVNVLGLRGATSVVTTTPRPEVAVAKSADAPAAVKEKEKAVEAKPAAADAPRERTALEIATMRAAVWSPISNPEATAPSDTPPHFAGAPTQEDMVEMAKRSGAEVEAMRQMLMRLPTK